MLMNIRWLNFDFQPDINLETTLGHRHWLNVILSTLFCQRWNNVDKHRSAQLSFSTKFQRWNNVGSSTLNRHNSIDVVSTLFCQRWKNVDKCTSAQLSFSTKYQRWCVCWASTLFYRRIYAPSVGFKMKPLRKSLFQCWDKIQPNFCRKACWK